MRKGSLGFLKTYWGSAKNRCQSKASLRLDPIYYDTVARIRAIRGIDPENVMTPGRRQQLEAELSKIRWEFEERKANIPAHSIRPHQLVILEQLQKQIDILERALRQED